MQEKGEKKDMSDLVNFPNFRNKDVHSSMFEPCEFMNYLKKIGRYPDFKVPKAAILCYQSKLLNYVLEKHKATKVSGFTRSCYLLDDTDGEIMILGQFGVGSPSAVLILEELIAFGVKNFISLGTAGALQKEQNIGDIVVCEKAIRDEGTSHHYIKSAKYSFPSREITKRIEEEFNQRNVYFTTGTSWTIDAPYRETVEEARHYQSEGVLTVEMEASALFTVAEYRNVRLGSMFTISDSLAELVWKPEMESKETATGLEILYQVALKVLQECSSH